MHEYTGSINCTSRSRQARNEGFRPGWYSDALIPARNPLGGEPLKGRYTAMPFDLPPNETHGFWIDLKIPASAKPGAYHGTYRVTADGGKSMAIPVELTVWDFQLPDTPTLVTALGSPVDRLRGYYKRRAKQDKEPEPKDWDSVQRQVSDLLCDNRVNATPPHGTMVPVAQPDGSFVIPKEQIDAFRRFVDRYHINAFQTPHPSSVVKDPDTQRNRLQAWLWAYDRAAKELDRPEVVFYTYLRDEPNDKEAYRYVQKWGLAVRSARSIVKVMVVEQTWTQDKAWGDLYGAVDIWCPLFSLLEPESAAKRQALGEVLWTYTALCQREPTPWWHTDYPLLNYRVPAWIAWRYRIRGILYWGGMSYWNDVEDPWTHPETLDRRDRRPELVLQRRRKPLVSRPSRRLRRCGGEPAVEGAARLGRRLPVHDDSRTTRPGRPGADDRAAARRVVLQVGEEPAGLCHRAAETRPVDRDRRKSSRRQVTGVSPGN